MKWSVRPAIATKTGFLFLSSSFELKTGYLKDKTYSRYGRIKNKTNQRRIITYQSAAARRVISCCRAFHHENLPFHSGK